MSKSFNKVSLLRLKFCGKEKKIGSREPKLTRAELAFPIPFKKSETFMNSINAIQTKFQKILQSRSRVVRGQEWAHMCCKICVNPSEPSPVPEGTHRWNKKR